MSFKLSRIISRFFAQSVVERGTSLSFDEILSLTFARRLILSKIFTSSQLC